MQEQNVQRWEGVMAPLGEHANSQSLIPSSPPNLELQPPRRSQGWTPGLSPYRGRV